MNPTTDAGEPKPRLALAIATGLGLGYLPKAPGTFGSLGGILLTIVAFETTTLVSGNLTGAYLSAYFLSFLSGFVIVVSLLGVWAASRVATYLQTKDPQIVVVDEVAGQMISYLGLLASASFALNWIYLLAGFILFRVFDIWKPFPARLAESLPSGLGIMADDWVAGLYAALALVLARQLGL